MSKTESLLRLSDVLDILEAVIYSGKVANEKPVSAMLVAPPESAKTQALMYFYGTRTLKYYSSVTSKPLLDLKPEIEAGTIRHIVIPEFSSISAHDKSTTNRLITVLAMLIEDGAVTYADASRVIEFSSLPRIGLIAACTPSVWHDRRSIWIRHGYISRFLPICFEYAKQTTKYIHSAIASGHKLPDPECITLPDKPVEVEIPQNHAEAIETFAKELGDKYSSYGFRYHRAFRALVKGRALTKSRTIVTAEEIADLSRWLKFFDDRDPVEI